MPLKVYTSSITLDAAIITAATLTHIVAGGTDYPIPPTWGARRPQVGDWLARTPGGTLIWLPAHTMASLELTPRAGPFIVGDRVICVRANPPQVMTVAEVAPGGYNCATPTSQLTPYYVGSDLIAAP